MPKDVKFQTVVVSAGRQCSYFTLMAEHRFRMLEKRALWTTFGRKREKVIGEWRKYYEGWNFNSGNYLFATDTK